MSAVALGPIGLVPIGEGKTFDVRGHAVAVFRTRAGEVFATQAYCPHKGGPLADGIVGAGKVVCPYHARRFDLATGCADDRACEPIATYPVRVTDEGEIVLDLAEDAA